MFVMLKNPKSGETKGVKVGFSWVLFFFSGFLGIPLFIRGLHIWGAIFILLWIVQLVAPSISQTPADEFALLLVLFCIQLGLSIWLGIAGNELTAKNYLRQGWEFGEPDSQHTKHAKVVWKLA